MNPFKQKQLNEFTITDCEQYIAYYPYGEHINEVKRQLKQLKEGEKKKKVEETKELSETLHKRSESPVRKKKLAKSQINETQKETTNSYTVTSSSNKVNDSGNVVKNILMWILIIVAVIIAGTIIIIILEAMFPDMKLNGGTARYVIYPALLGVGKWIKDLFD